jgi:hypothetical protein
MGGARSPVEPTPSIGPPGAAVRHVSDPSDIASSRASAGSASALERTVESSPSSAARSDAAPRVRTDAPRPAHREPGLESPVVASSSGQHEQRPSLPTLGRESAISSPEREHLPEARQRAPANPPEPIAGGASDGRRGAVEPRAAAGTPAAQGLPVAAPSRVSISIGRIEVRAVMSEPRHEPPVQALEIGPSLDAYLKRFAENGR